MLEATGICKRYKGQAVLDAVSFALPPGRFVGVAGHNGSGKSTLLSILAGVQPPDQGDVRWNGQSVLGDRAFLRAQVGYAPQHGGLLPDLRVDETARFWQRAYGMAGGGLFAPSGVFAMLGLAPLARRKVGKLSGGERQRLSIALALMHGPEVVLLDEAMAPLDRAHRQRLAEWLAGHLARGGALAACSHELEDLLGRCDDLLVLRQGRAAYWGAADAFPRDAASLDALLDPLAVV